MVVQVVPPPIRHAPPGAENGSAGAEHPVLELVGEAQRRQRPPEPAESGFGSDETLRALRLLALDNLLDIVKLRETIAAQEVRIHALEREADTWRERAIAESDGRQADALSAHKRERDLISVVHHQMLTMQALNDEVDHRWRPPWRRRPRIAA
jgi:hypothetical protein